MRITGVRARNLLSYDELNLDMTDSSFMVLVGPNGAGKTNIFRLIRHLLDGISCYGKTPRIPWQDWVDTLDVWTRRRQVLATIELDITWTRASEEEILGNFIQMVLANPEDIARELAEGESANSWRSWPGWTSFFDVLQHAIPAQEIGGQLSGTLGCRYVAPSDLVLYFKPTIAQQTWEFRLYPNTGIVRASQIPPSSYSHPSLAVLWIRSLSAKVRGELKSFLVDEDLSGSLSVHFDWDQIWKEVQRESEKHNGAIVVNVDVRTSEISVSRSKWARSLHTLIGEDHDTSSLTLRSVLNYLLQHCVISEDLLSPPEREYTSITWRQHIDSLSSRHLGAYLLNLKNGEDDERHRFSKIVKMFHGLTSRYLDAKVRYEFRDHTGLDPTPYMHIDLVQSVIEHGQSILLIESGSGFVEIAYLCAVLNSDNSQVVLLDEPGRSLHPQALLRLRSLLQDHSTAEELYPQLFVITHSPYLVPSSMPEVVRRVHGKSGAGSRITRLGSPVMETQKAQHERDRLRLSRQDRWGRSPNWPALLFTAVTLVVDGETELGALPVWYEKIYGEPIEAVGASVLSLGGKASGGANILDLDAFGMAWIALVDGDSLKPKSGNVWAELKKAGHVTDLEANRLRCSSFADQVQALKENYNTYVMGHSPTDQFEAILQKENPNVLLPPQLGDSKVIKGRWWAENVPCPEIIKELFEALRKVAQG